MGTLPLPHYLGTLLENASMLYMTYSLSSRYSALWGKKIGVHIISKEIKLIENIWQHGKSVKLNKSLQSLQTSPNMVINSRTCLFSQPPFLPPPF